MKTFSFWMKTLSLSDQSRKREWRDTEIIKQLGLRASSTDVWMCDMQKIKRRRNSVFVRV